MLEKTISEQLKCALKSRDTVRVSVLRMLISEMKNKKIADIVKELDDDKIIGIIHKMVRQHKESIEQFKRGNREDLVEKEFEELKILEEFLPEPVTREELEKIVMEAISQAGAVSLKDMGEVMKSVMDKTGGRADGKEISGLVREKLAGKT
ncbi:MAG: GatB/YqeY domain-containing protein [Candidatus Omnitrophota bacterium]